MACIRRSRFLDCRSRSRAMVSGGILVEPIASVIVCQGSEASKRWETVMSGLLFGRLEGEAERVGAAVPIGARLDEEWCGKEVLLLFEFAFEITTELRRRGW